MKFAALIAAAALPAAALAASPDYTWNPSGASNDWNTADANWTGASTIWSNGGNAFFTGTGETISFQSALTAGTVTVADVGFVFTTPLSAGSPIGSLQATQTRIGSFGGNAGASAMGSTGATGILGLSAPLNSTTLAIGGFGGNGSSGGAYGMAGYGGGHGGAGTLNSSLGPVSATTLSIGGNGGNGGASDTAFGNSPGNGDIGGKGGAGTLNNTGASFTITTLAVGGTGGTGGHVAGILVQNGGIGGAAGAGTLTSSGGTISVQTLALGGNGGSGGAYASDTGAGGNGGTGGNGTLNLTGGTLVISGASTLGGARGATGTGLGGGTGGVGGTGTLSVSGGASISASGTTTIRAGSALNLGWDGSAASSIGTATFGAITNAGTLSVTQTAGDVTFGTITNTGTFSLQHTGGSVTLGGVVSGISALTLNTGGTTTITATQTYTGGTTVSAGTLNLSHATDSLADSGAVTVNGGTLALGANSDTIGSLALSSGSVTSTGTLTVAGITDVSGGSLNAKLAAQAITVTGTAATANFGTGSTATSLTLGTDGGTGGEGVLTATPEPIVAGTPGTAGTLTITSGDLALSGILQVGANGGKGGLTFNAPGGGGGTGGAGTLNLTGGSLSAAGITLGGSDGQTGDSLGGPGGAGGTGGTGTMNVSGGAGLTVSSSTTILAGSSLNLGWDGTAASTTGTVTFGAITNAGTLSVTQTAGDITFGAITNTGTFNLRHTGGTVTLGGLVSGISSLTLNTGGTTTITASQTYTGGTTVSSGTLNLSHATDSLADTGAVTVNGGTLALGANADTIGSLNLSSGSVTSTGTLTVAGATTLSGGTLNAKLAAQAITVTGTPVTTFGAGSTATSLTLGSAGGPGGDGTTMMTTMPGSPFSPPTIIFVPMPGPAGTPGTAGTLNLASGSLAVSGAVQLGGNSGANGASLGALGGTGGTGGSGTLNISGGSLSANSITLGGSAVGSAAGGTGTLNLTGGSLSVVSLMTVNSGSTLALTAGTSFTAGNLVLQSGSTTALTLGAPSTTALGSVGGGGASGNLTLGGSVTIAETSVGAIVGGVYRIFDYTGTLTDNGYAVTVATGGPLAKPLVATDFTLSTATAGQVNLIYGSDLLFWDGAGATGDNTISGGAGTWSAAPADTAWTNDTGSANGAQSPNPGFVVFSGTGGTVSVDNTGGAVGATGMQFTVDGYTLSGGDIALTNDSTSHDVVIRVGSGALGDENLSATIGSALTGAAAIRKTDAGTLILSGNNTYTGGTTVTAGTLRAGSAQAFGSGAVTVDTGATADLSGNSVANDITLSGSGVAGAGALVNSAGSASLTGTVTLADAATLGGAGDISVANAFSSSSARALTKVGTGALSLSGDNSAALASITVSAGSLVANSPAAIGSASVAVATGASVTLADHNTTLANTFTGLGNLALTGSGTTTLAASRLNNGVVSIGSGHTLDLGTDSAITQSASITALAGSTLRGRGTVSGNLIINAGATHTPGNSPGIVNVGGDYTNNGNLVMEIAGNGGAGAVNGHDQVNATGAVVVNGTLTVALTGGFNPFGGGTQAFDLFTSGTGNISGTAFNAAVLPATTLGLISTSGGTVTYTSYDSFAALPGVSLTPAATAFTGALVAQGTGAGSTAANLLSIYKSGGAAALASAVNTASPAPLAALSTLAIEQSRGTAETIRTRLGSLRRPAIGSTATASTAKAASSFLAAPGLVRDSGAWAAFAAVSGSEASTDSKLSSFDRRTFGGKVGLENRVSSDLNLGLALGYDKGLASLHNHGGRIEQQHLNASAYLGTKFDDATFVYLGAFAGLSDYESKRNAGFGDITGDTEGRDYGLTALLGHEFELGNDISITPYAGLTAAWAYVDGFTESGALVSTIEDHREGSFRSKLGADIDWKVSSTPTSSVRIGLTTAWEHELSGNSVTLPASIGGSSFNTSASGIARDILSFGPVCTLDWEGGNSVRASVQKQYGFGDENGARFDLSYSKRF